MAADHGEGTKPPAYYKGLHILLAVVQSVDLSSLRIHQGGDVVAQADEQMVG